MCDLSIYARCLGIIRLFWNGWKYRYCHITGKRAWHHPNGLHLARDVGWAVATMNQLKKQKQRKLAHG